MDQSWYFTPQGHLESMIPHLPGHGRFRVGKNAGARGRGIPRIAANVHSRSGHQRGGAVTEQTICEIGVIGQAVLVVQTAQFHRDEEHAGTGIAVREAARHAQSVQRAMAPHETHIGTLCTRGQLQRLDQRDVGPRCREAAAGYRDQVGYFLRRRV